jgi:hypothetical protein
MKVPEDPPGIVRFKATSPLPIPDLDLLSPLPAAHDRRAPLHEALHEEKHGLRSFLYRTFMLPLVGMGFFVTAPEMVEPLPAGPIVQIMPGGRQKAEETQKLDALIRAHQSGLPDPEHALRGESLARAIEAVAEIPEKVADKDDAIRSVLDAYANLEAERGKTDEDVAEGLKKIREWQNLG